MTDTDSPAVEKVDPAGEPAGRKRRTSAALWGAMLAGVVFIGLAIVFAGRFGTDVSVARSPLVGKPAPDVVIPGFDGKGDIDLKTLRGKVVVVNFWASWCLSCRQEHPALVAASNRYAPLGVAFIGVDYQDGEEAANAFLDELGRGEHYRYGTDPDSTVAFAYGVLGLPETFFVDPNGIVVGKISGPTSYALLSRTLDDILLGKAIDSVKTGEVQDR